MLNWFFIRGTSLLGCPREQFGRYTIPQRWCYWKTGWNKCSWSLPSTGIYTQAFEAAAATKVRPPLHYHWYWTNCSDCRMPEANHLFVDSIEGR